MPELPEIETIRKGLSYNIIGRKIVKIFRSDKKLRFDSDLNLQNLQGLIIKKINRRARYLIIDLGKANFAENNICNHLIIHLGMSGRLVFKTSDYSQKQKHDHFICSFEEGGCLIFNDPRRFGFIDLINHKNLTKHKMLANLGLEPLCKEFNAEYLLTKLQNKTANIKTTLMDNRIVVGVGNIYANESLFDAKISPLTKAYAINKIKAGKLVVSIKKILTKAIELGGSSINDYVNNNGESGKFQNSFKVYGQENEKCLHCDKIIAKIIQNGRSSFYCNNCQK